VNSIKYTAQTFKDMTKKTVWSLLYLLLGYSTSLRHLLAVYTTLLQKGKKIQSLRKNEGLIHSSCDILQGT